jgi:hypothetical protein
MGICYAVPLKNENELPKIFFFVQINYQNLSSNWSSLICFDYNTVSIPASMFLYKKVEKMTSSYKKFLLHNSSSRFRCYSKVRPNAPQHAQSARQYHPMHSSSKGQWRPKFLGAFTKLRLANISFFVYVSPSVRSSFRIEQHGSHKNDFH